MLNFSIPNRQPTPLTIPPSNVAPRRGRVILDVPLSRREFSLSFDALGQFQSPEQPRPMSTFWFPDENSDSFYPVDIGWNLYDEAVEYMWGNVLNGDV